MRMSSRAAIILIASLILGGGSHAAADGGGSVNTEGDYIDAQAWKKRKNEANNRRTAKATPARSKASASSKPKYTYVPKDEFASRQQAYQSELQRAIQNNAAAATAQGRCTDSPTGLACNGGSYVNLPADLNIRPAGDPATPATPVAPTVSPEQAAYIATARLQLTAPKPMIGPPPTINEWKMAAVGYPMWLWAEGNLNPAPVSDSVYDIAVSLDARLVKVVYAMGDGRKVTCTNVNRPWTPEVAAGAPSPVCGYTYQKPSLPKGEYTITANAVWAVDWSVNSTQGTIPFYQSASTQVPVGELQVLNR